MIGRQVAVDVRTSVLAPARSALGVGIVVGSWAPVVLVTAVETVYTRSWAELVLVVASVEM